MNGKSEFQNPKKPEWWNCKLGISDKVLSPWTPMKVKGNTVSCWGRDYKFNALPVPSQIATQGASILDKPMAVNTVINGKSINWKSEYCRIVEKKDSRVVMHTRSRSGKVTLDGKATMEYDGFMRVDMTLTGSKSAKLDNYSLDIPIKNESAKLICAQTPFLPTHKAWPYWDGTKDGFVPSKSVAGSFTPYIWLGNDYHGLVWCAESQENWANKDQGKVIEIIPKNDYTVIRIKFIDYPVSLDKPLKLTFALQATPVKIASSRKRYQMEIGYGDQNRNLVVNSANGENSDLELANTPGYQVVNFLDYLKKRAMKCALSGVTSGPRVSDIQRQNCIRMN